MHYYFRRLIKYNDWANQEIIQSIETHETDDREIMENLSHILNAEGIWISRIDPHKGLGYTLHEVHTPETIKKLRLEITNQWMDYIRHLHDEHFYKVFQYVNTQGVQFNTVLADIISHMTHHGSYHRGKIAKRFRDLNIAPPVTDYIKFARENDFELKIAN